MTSMRLVLANLVKRFRVEFAPGYDSSTVFTDMRDSLTGHAGALRLSFAPKEEGGGLEVRV